MEQSDIRNARRALEWAAKLDPDDVASIEQLAKFATEDRRRRAELLMLAGEREAKRLNSQRALGKTAAAAKAYGRALVLAPNDSGSPHGLGAVHMARNEPGKAVPLLRGTTCVGEIWPRPCVRPVTSAVPSAY